ncbi:low affinity iron permease family protein [Ciceribacter azotifigens]|uniref:low affinity iron permease family protein n=1 Tax=Ciceribacter azotifigens TaxID=2069303 RepID=UPI003A8B672C
MTDKISIFARFATAVSEWTGRPAVFALALASIVAWGLTGPVFDFSETWQLVVNTGTTIITFLMVFVLQNAQSRDTRAIQTKLDELILSSKAENRFIGIENLDEEELKRLNALLGEAAKRDRHAREPVLSTDGDGLKARGDDTEEAPPLERTAPR